MVIVTHNKWENMYKNVFYVPQMPKVCLSFFFLIQVSLNELCILLAQIQYWLKNRLRGRHDTVTH